MPFSSDREAWVPATGADGEADELVDAVLPPPELDTATRRTTTTAAAPSAAPRRVKRRRRAAFAASPCSRWMRARRACSRRSFLVAVGLVTGIPPQRREIVGAAYVVPPGPPWRHPPARLMIRGFTPAAGDQESAASPTVA